ncbi:Uncharacterized protein OBRU01_13271, partial [Operophtera brumata]
MDLWDLLDSDDDEEIVEFLNRPTIARQLFTRTELFDSLDEIKFVRRFRLTKGTTAILLQQIETHLRYRIDRVAAITPVNQLLCALRFYATGSQLITCGDMIGVHESTACRIVHRTSYMMTPLADGSATTRGQLLYQESQIKTRNVVERAFGIWKRRFPILSRGISIHLHRVPGIIVATAVLHNIAILQNEDIPLEDSEYPLLDDNVGNTASTQQRGS